MAICRTIVVSAESLRGLAEVRLRDDVVALKNRPRPVAGDLHGHPLRDAGSDHVADSRPAEIVKEHSRNPGLFTGCLPRGEEPKNPFPFSVKDPRDDDALLSFKLTCCRPLRSQDGQEFR